MRERVLGALVIIAASIVLLAEGALSLTGILEMTRHFIEIWLIALPMTLIIISGGIDLSVGSIVGLCVVTIGGSWAQLHVNVWLAVLIAIIAGLVAGAFNGAVIAYLRVPPLIVTLATLAIYRGLAYGISQAKPVHGFPHTFLLLGQGYIGPAPVQLILFVSLALAVGIFLTRTVWGRYTYAVGYNETAARFSGIPVDKLKLALYALSGLLSGVAGVIFVARTGSARADAGLGYELDVIAAVLLGGASITGGEGTVIGTVLGVLLIALVRRSLTLLLVPTEGQVVVVGALLIASVALDQWLRQRRAMRWSETRTSNAD